MGSLSRRGFLRGAATAAAGVALAGTAAAGVTGCTAATTQDAKGDSEESIGAESLMAKPALHECDVLVLGGGIAGMEAALRVVEQGKSAVSRKL